MLTINLTDACNDGYRINYKFYDVDNNLVWPSASTYWYTEYYNRTYTHNLRCETGARVCYGGNTGSRYWGVGVNGNYSCSSCCYTCTNGTVSVRLTC